MTDTASSLIDTVLPVALFLGVGGAFWLVLLGVQKLHQVRVAFDVSAKTAAQHVLAVILGLVDDTVTDSAVGLKKDIDAARADGTVTPAELKDIAGKEWTRIKAFIGTRALDTLEKGLAVGGVAVEAYVTNLIATKLKVGTTTAALTSPK